MSQHHFTTPDVRVLAGWDRPLQQHFLVVFSRHDDDEILYSNLADPHLVDGGMTVELVMERLAQMRIPTPPMLEANLRADAARNAGNDIVRYDPEPDDASL